MKIDTIQITSVSPANTSVLADKIASVGSAPDFVSCHYNATCDAGLISDVLSCADVPVHCATSCQGSVTEGVDKKPVNLTAFCIWDPAGDYGTALSSFVGRSAQEAAEEATRQALGRADREGEKPDLVLISATPGQEEAVLAGIMAVVGSDVPIFGGTAADNNVSGNWAVSDAKDFHANGVVVSVLFPSTRLHFAYHNGYAPIDHSGEVTRVEGRKLIEIDGRPAADVYNAWTGGKILPATLGSEHNILAEATMAPLGRYINQQDDVANYLLAHPAQLHSDGSLGLFAEVQKGEKLTQMWGDQQALSERAGRVASQAVAVGNVQPEDIAGGYMIYCGGCLLAVEDRVDVILDGVKAALPDAPFQAAFTFGEQGQMIGGQNWHGNLMISCIVFTHTPI